MQYEFTTGVTQTCRAWVLLNQPKPGVYSLQNGKIVWVHDDGKVEMV